MNKNIILAGVGGQGILTIASIIDLAAISQNMYFKQAEVHGMSQRGGAVQSHVRISETPVYSDLISLKQADFIISLEPMEALRYLPYLSEKGIIVSAKKAYVNISNYPDESEIINAYNQLENTFYLIDVEKITSQTGNSRTANIVMVGAAHHYIGIGKEIFIKCIRSMFAPKGEKIVNQNLEAFALGSQLINKN